MREPLDLRDVVLLVNPAAGRGRGARYGEAVAEGFRNAGIGVRVEASTAPGDERRLAREAAQRGASVVAVVGGDGAIHHTARGLLEAVDAGEGAPVPSLAIFSAGTGNDLVKSLGSPSHDVDLMVQRVVTGDTRRIDVGLIDDVPFVNAAGFGFDVEVLQRLQRGRERGSRLDGSAAYVITALGALGSYRGFEVTVGDTAMARQLMIVFANGRCFGGTFHIAPDASLHDGALDCVAIGDVPPWGRIPLFVQATRGRHLRHPAVRLSRCTDLVLRFAAPPMFECDGEPHQAMRSEVRVSVRPGALRMIG